MTAEAQLTKTPVAPIVHVGGSESSSAEATGSSHSSLLRNGARDPMTNGKRLMENTIKASLPITDQDSASPPAKKLRLSEEQKISTIADAVSTILECLEDDPNRQGLRKTPTRYAKVSHLSCRWPTLLYMCSRNFPPLSVQCTAADFERSNWDVLVFLCDFLSARLSFR